MCACARSSRYFLCAFMGSPSHMMYFYFSHFHFPFWGRRVVAVSCGSFLYFVLIIDVVDPSRVATAPSPFLLSFRDSSVFGHWEASSDIRWSSFNSDTFNLHSSFLPWFSCKYKPYAKIFLSCILLLHVLYMLLCLYRFYLLHYYSFAYPFLFTFSSLFPRCMYYILCISLHHLRLYLVPLRNDLGSPSLASQTQRFTMNMRNRSLPLVAVSW